MAIVRVTRRSFLVGSGLSIGGLALGLAPGLFADAAHAADFGPNALVHLAADGQVTIVCHRSEMGQGIRSSLPVLIADELGADLARVTVTQADGDARYGDQNTDGSSSIRAFYDDLRRAGATARTMLIAAAAARWKVKPGQCEAHDHAVHGPGGRSLAFGALVAAAAKLPVPAPAKVVLRPTRELPHARAGGAPVKMLDAPAIVVGAAPFAADLRLPDLLVAVIARPPVVGGKLTRLDAKPALAIPGVKQVIELPAPKPPWAYQPWGGVAVLADTTWAAMRGRAALDLVWEGGDGASYDSAAFRQELLASARAPGTALRTVGDVDGALAKATRVIEAEYHVPHLAHLTMEPPCAVARAGGGRCEIWASTQSPQDARAQAAESLGIAEDKVTVHVTFLGGGFGRKSKADFVAEAAILAQKAGVPVRVQWTREDDVRHDYYNTVSTQRLAAGLDAQGKVTAWLHRTAFPPIGATFTRDATRPGAGDLQQGVLDLALDVPNVRAEACEARAHVRIGWYRSVYNIFHAFAIGSFIDELAHARGTDPRDTWLELIGPARTVSLAQLGVAKLENYGASLDDHPVDAGRLRHVIERVTALASWSRRAQDERALGLAAHRSFLTYTGVVVSVVHDERRKLRVDEAWIVMDAGAIVNADRVSAQLQGAVAMGLSNALYGGVTMKGGVTEQSNFHDARIARIADVPRRLHVEFVESDGRPCGVGEPGVPPVGAAVANAVFALTGQRVREFPILPALA